LKTLDQRFGVRGTPSVIVAVNHWRIGNEVIVPLSEFKELATK
jgi:hypothetical protein